MIDTAAKGLGCYCKDPGESDTLREHVMLTKFAGFFAQNRFLKERSYPQVEYLQVIWSEDWKERAESLRNCRTNIWRPVEF
jgi:hypothetical protein